MAQFNLADCFDIVAGRKPDQEALVQGDHRITWANLGRRAGNLAAWMKERLAEGTMDD